MTSSDTIRFFKKTKINKHTGCLEWTSGKDKDGYGLFKLNNRTVRVHRLVLHLLGEEIKNKIVCHKCDNPTCLNPLHLFIGTHSDNVRDCVNKGRQKEIRKTHCPKNHPFSGENLYVVRKTGKRQCNVCRKVATRKGNEKKRLQNEIRK